MKPYTNLILMEVWVFCSLLFLLIIINHIQEKLTMLTCSLHLWRVQIDCQTISYICSVIVLEEL